MCDANLDSRDLEPGEALGGFIHLDTLNRGLVEDYGALWVIGLHVTIAAQIEHVNPTGALSTKGLTDLFTDATMIRWQLRPIGADQPVDL